VRREEVIAFFCTGKNDNPRVALSVEVIKNVAHQARLTSVLPAQEHHIEGLTEGRGRLKSAKGILSYGFLKHALLCVACQGH
jgi:hypothetical protein